VFSCGAAPLGGESDRWRRAAAATRPPIR